MKTKEDFFPPSQRIYSAPCRDSLQGQAVTSDTKVCLTVSILIYPMMLYGARYGRLFWPVVQNDNKFWIDNYIYNSIKHLEKSFLLSLSLI